MTAGPAVSVSGCHVQYWPCSLLFRAVPHIRMVLRLFQRHLEQRFPTFPSLTSPTLTPNKYQNEPTNKILHESQNAQWKETKVSHNRCKGINILLLTILCPLSSEGQHDMHILRTAEGYCAVRVNLSIWFGFVSFSTGRVMAQAVIH